MVGQRIRTPTRSAGATITLCLVVGLDDNEKNKPSTKCVKEWVTMGRVEGQNRGGMPADPQSRPKGRRPNALAVPPAFSVVGIALLSVKVSKTAAP
jgi:hypothetical protein